MFFENWKSLVETGTENSDKVNVFHTNVFSGTPRITIFSEIKQKRMLDLLCKLIDLINSTPLKFTSKVLSVFISAVLNLKEEEIVL